MIVATKGSRARPSCDAATNDYDRRKNALFPQHEDVLKFQSCQHYRLGDVISGTLFSLWLGLDALSRCRFVGANVGEAIVVSR